MSNEVLSCLLFRSFRLASFSISKSMGIEFFLTYFSAFLVFFTRMISVDANTCLKYLKLKEKSKIEDVSDYFLQFSQDCLREGFDKLTIIWDQDSTDKKRMKSQLKFHLINAEISDKIVVDFIHTPTYSPNFNLVEYIIHLLRLKLLHHLSLDVNIQQVKGYFRKFFPI